MLPATLGALYNHIRSFLSEAAADSPDIDARLILAKRGGFTWSDIIARPDSQVNTEILSVIEADMRRRSHGEPISRIYGTREFWGMDFAIGPDTLDPRPDTETLVEAALQAFQSSPPEMILDLGTGSGCILLALLKEWQGAHGVGVDLSFGALEYAQNNARSHNLQDRATFIQSDWGEKVAGEFDLIVSNPPYISNQIIPTLSKEVRNHDPILALDGGNDGLECYRKIIFYLSSLLKPGGTALFEIGFDQREDVMRLVEESGFFVRHVHLDLAGNPRVVEISCGDK